MGCDIHWTLERHTQYGWVGEASNFTPREPNDGFYHPFGDRDYTFFAMLAGVRGEGPDAKGYPDDASPLALLNSDIYGGDGHSHSWEMLEAFCRMHSAAQSEEATAKVVAAHLTNQENGLIERYFRYLNDEPSKYRVLFFFDN